MSIMTIRRFLIKINNILKWRLRNIFIDPFYIIKWDVFPRLKRRTSIHTIHTSNKEINNEVKIPVVIMTYKRPIFFEKTLESFIDLNGKNLEQFLIIALIQGDKDEETEKIINKHKNQFYNVIYPGENLGCAGGYSLLMKEALKLNLPYIINLQDDFVSNESLSDFIPELIELMERNMNIGYIRLRSIKDKVMDYNKISRRKIKYKRVTGNVASGNAHFTFNPTIAKSSVIDKIIPTNSEKDAMEKYQKLGLKTGQLLTECFSHIGHERVRDWVK